MYRFNPTNQLTPSTTMASTQVSKLSVTMGKAGVSFAFNSDECKEIFDLVLAKAGEIASRKRPLERLQEEEKAAKIQREERPHCDECDGCGMDYCEVIHQHADGCPALQQAEEVPVEEEPAVEEIQHEVPAAAAEEEPAAEEIQHEVPAAVEEKKHVISEDEEKRIRALEHPPRLVSHLRIWLDQQRIERAERKEQQKQQRRQKRMEQRSNLAWIQTNITKRTVQEAEAKAKLMAEGKFNHDLCERMVISGPNKGKQCHYHKCTATDSLCVHHKKQEGREAGDLAVARATTRV